jgi:hypothetical protein
LTNKPSRVGAVPAIFLEESQTYFDLSRVGKNIEELLVQAEIYEVGALANVALVNDGKHAGI